MCPSKGTLFVLETGSLYVVLAVQDLILLTFDSQSHCPSLPSAGIEGVHHHWA